MSCFIKISRFTISVAPSRGAVSDFLIHNIHQSCWMNRLPVLLQGPNGWTSLLWRQHRPEL